VVGGQGLGVRAEGATPTHDTLHRVAPQVRREVAQVPAPVHVRDTPARIRPQALGPPARALVEHGLWVLAACSGGEGLGVLGFKV